MYDEKEFDPAAGANEVGCLDFLMKLWYLLLMTVMALPILDQWQLSFWLDSTQYEIHLDKPNGLLGP
jgi:hypothetical protein